MVAPTETVIADVPAPGAGMEIGLNATVVPPGTPDAARLIALLNPPLIAVVMVEVPEFPCAMLSEKGEAPTVKLADPDLRPFPNRQSE